MALPAGKRCHVVPSMTSSSAPKDRPLPLGNELIGESSKLHEWGGSTRSRSSNSFDTRETSNEILSRYEHMIALLTTQALSQQEEIVQLKEALNKGACPRDTVEGGKGPCKGPVRNIDDGPLRAPLKCKESKKMPKRWRYRVENHTMQLLEAYMWYMDECLAQGMVKRLRRVTRDHVIRSLDKEVCRVLQERIRVGKNEQLPTQQTHDDNHHRDDCKYSLPPELEGKMNELNIGATVTTPPPPPPPPLPGCRAPSANRGDDSHEILPVTSNAGSRLSTANCKNSTVSTRAREMDTRSASATEPYVSFISAEPSDTDSGATLLCNQYLWLLEQLQRKVLMLEDYLAAASASASSSALCTNESNGILSSPSRVETSADHSNRTGRDPSSLLSTNSRSVNSASDDVKILLDIFEGRQPTEAVQKLLL